MRKIPTIRKDGGNLLIAQNFVAGFRHQYHDLPLGRGFVIGCVYMLLHWQDYKKQQILTLIGAMVTAAALFLVQMLFFDTFLITFYVTSLGVLVIYLSLETPDYEKLIDTMSQLHEAQAREAAAQAKANLSREVMLALSKAVDAKDHYTNGHSARVAKYAREIARRMGKS